MKNFDFVTWWLLTMCATGILFAVCLGVGVALHSVAWANAAGYCFLAIFAEGMIGFIPAEMQVARNRYK